MKIKLKAKGVASVEEFIRRVFFTKKNDEEELFYRGHADETFKLVPRVLRFSYYRENEDRLFREMLVLNPADFAEDKSTLDKLVRMQHHSLPTRLLDITSNPLMGLFFACKSHPKETGEVVVLKIRRKDIKFYDSDTASCLANLAKLSSAYKELIDTKTPPVVFNKSHPIPMLHHFIKEEKPYFLAEIDPKDMNRVICVRTKFDNTRIASQTGACLLFGLKATLPEAGDKQIGVERITVSVAAKKDILRELDTLNINDRTVFPYIENSAKYLATKYRTGAKIKKL